MYSAEKVKLLSNWMCTQYYGCQTGQFYIGSKTYYPSNGRQRRKQHCVSHKVADLFTRHRINNQIAKQEPNTMRKLRSDASIMTLPAYKGIVTMKIDKRIRLNSEDRHTHKCLRIHLATNIKVHATESHFSSEKHKTN